MASNRIAFLDGAGIPLRIADAPMPEPGPNDIVIKNHVIAINPIDYKQQVSGMFIKAYPYVLGSDVAGTVHSVGSSITRYKAGDRVVGHAWAMLTGKIQDGAFSLYSNVPVANSAVVPSQISLQDAAVLPLAIDTAISGLHLGLGIPLPSLNPEASGQVIVVYGAASSIGSMTTQLATAAGVRVIGVGSTTNHDLVRSCGAHTVVDYKDPDFVSSVVEAVKNSGDSFAGIYDAISKTDTYAHDIAIFDKLGGGRLACSGPPPENLPENIQASSMFGLGEFSFPVWEEYVAPALEQGKLKCLPEPMVVGTGLEALPLALEKRKAGVSAKKLVVGLV